MVKTNLPQILFNFEKIITNRVSFYDLEEIHIHNFRPHKLRTFYILGILRAHQRSKVCLG